MKIGIVGSAGVVGSAVKYGMEKLGHEVRPHDIILDTKLQDVLDTEVCFICVPTNELEDGSCDTDIVESVISDLNHFRYEGVIAIKSTVAPGTTERIRSDYYLKIPDRPYDPERPYRFFRDICFVPEFLRERCAIADFTENHDICVVGTQDNEVFELIKAAHGKYPQKFVRMTPTEAELSKYFSNVFNALRIIFANGFYEVCQKLNADYTKIKNAVVERPTLVDMYLDCNERFRGYGGYCLPKDSRAFALLAKDLGVSADIFDVIVEDNKLYRTTVFDNMRD